MREKPNWISFTGGLVIGFIIGGFLGVGGWWLWFLMIRTVQP